jgi:cytochrome c-type biogenesis protein CcmH
MKKSVIALLLACLNWPAQAMIESYRFDTPQQEANYRELIFELRCLVCQNQNLADSNAQLAQDLRKQVHHLLVEKQADKQQVVDYMVQRYGDFVLYNPPLKIHTALLWFAPLLFVALGVIWLLTLLRKQANTLDKDTP